MWGSCGGGWGEGGKGRETVKDGLGEKGIKDLFSGREGNLYW